jgi:hypothetical protein
MPRYQVLLILILIIFALFFLLRCDFIAGELLNLSGLPAANFQLPRWLTADYRRSGPFVSDYIPLDPAALEPASGTVEEDSGEGGAYVNPSGSPYAPGTLADMIWQQKQQDQRYSN